MGMSGRAKVMREFNLEKNALKLRQLLETASRWNAGMEDNPGSGPDPAASHVSKLPGKYSTRFDPAHEPRLW